MIRLRRFGRHTPPKGDGAESAASPVESDTAEVTDDTVTSAPSPKTRARAGRVTRVLAYGVLPAIALILAIGAGDLKWMASSAHESDTARTESIQAATDATIKMLSYHPDTVERDLGSARDLLSGPFRDSYTSLTNDVVIPGAKQKQISAVATVPGASSVSASRSRAVVLVYVDQTIIVGKDAPSTTASAVKVTLDKSSGRWLVSDFTPV